MSGEFAMNRFLRMLGLSAVVVGSLSVPGLASSAFAGVPIPDPVTDAPLATSSGTQKAVLAGGCFWGMQLVFEHLKGVQHVTAGYSGGDAATAQYEVVSSGATGHAESVEIEYDPSQVTYGEILKVYFSVAHDPTELDRQGPDEGTQYRSSIFFADADQQKIAEAYIAQLNSAGNYSSPIVTTVVPLKAFYPAEDYHQDYAVNHPYSPYIMFNDAPKLADFKSALPDLYIAR
jgi:peptide-methionine (S)-S-oxide reductase